MLISYSRYTPVLLSEIKVVIHIGQDKFIESGHLAEGYLISS